jgi:hypothetical protein
VSTHPTSSTADIFTTSNPAKVRIKACSSRMSNGDEVPVSETFKKDFLKAFEGLEFKGE